MAVARVGGGFTVFHWSNSTDPGKVIGYADRVQKTAVQPVATPVDVQPMNALRPLEIAVPRAHIHGVLTLTLTELYNQAVWQRLAGLANSNDIIDIMEYMAGLDQGVMITEYIEPPNGKTYSETFYNCMITRVGDDEDIRIDTMLVNKDLEVWYTYSKKNWINSPARPATFT